METRKIQSVGGGTYTVSLPKAWAESVDIAAGSVVELHTHIDDLLVIQPQECETDAVTTIEIPITDDDPTHVERTIRAAYAAGLREVVLTGAVSDSQRRTVERVTRTLTGVTVASETDDRVVVQSMLDAGEVSIQQSVRQLQFVALSLHREATAALTGGSRIDDPSERDDQADRLYALVDRYFWRGLSRLDEVDALDLTRPELFTLWSTARELERVADHAERIARLAGAATADEATAGELQHLASEARSVVEDAVGVALGDTGIEAARTALDTRQRVREDAPALERRLFEASGTDYRLARIIDSLTRTAEHGGNIAELGIQSVIREGGLAQGIEIGNA